MATITPANLGQRYGVVDIFNDIDPGVPGGGKVYVEYRRVTDLGPVQFCGRSKDMPMFKGERLD
ncbi:hypothetical protein [uncultured Devosia sp.]|uniref:hypothetical protein n=1 Tax=uncultured Devosia sp. TaxID=211434 RepID=UPI0035CCA5EA